MTRIGQALAKDLAIDVIILAINALANFVGQQ